MFSSLLSYKQQQYCNEHNTIRLETLYGVRTYRVFCVLNMQVDDWDAATADFVSDKAFLQFVKRARKKALVDIDIAVGANDHILTLITCDRSYGGASGRLLVMAVEMKDEE